MSPAYPNQKDTADAVLLIMEFGREYPIETIQGEIIASLEPFLPEALAILVEQGFLDQNGCSYSTTSRGNARRIELHRERIVTRKRIHHMT